MTRITLIGISGSVTRPSRTTALVSEILDQLAGRLDAHTRLIELAESAPVLFGALTPGDLTAEGRDIVEAVETADLLVVGTPVYRGSYTGALKHLFDLVRREPLAAKPVILAATGGSALHGLVIDHALRPLFGFFNAFTIPTGLYATESAFHDYRLSDDVLRDRIGRAVAEAAALIEARSLLARRTDSPVLAKV